MVVYTEFYIGDYRGMWYNGLCKGLVCNMKDKLAEMNVSAKNLFFDDK